KATALYQIDGLTSHPRATRIPAKRQNNGIRSSANRLTFTELNSRATYSGNDTTIRRMAFLSRTYRQYPIPKQPKIKSGIPRFSGKYARKYQGAGLPRGNMPPSAEPYDCAIQVVYLR